jgi:hypothetical protein
MDSNDIPRDPESGQFTSSYDGSRQFEFTPMADNKPREEDWPTYGSSDQEIRAAAAEMQERRGVQTEDAEAVVWHDRYGEPLPSDISTTKEQAADALNAYRQAKAEAAQAELDRDLRSAIDNPRLELEVTDPETAKLYGFKHELDRAVGEFATEMGVDPAAVRPPATQRAAPEQPARESVPGLDPDVERALQNPQIRHAVEQQMAEAVQAKADYEAKVQEANNWARASLVHEFPELGRLPVEQWENALLTVQAQDPLRFQKGVGVINQVARVNAEQTRIQNEHATRAHQQESMRQQQIADWSRGEAARYDAWAAKEGLDMASFTPAVGKYIETNLGMSRDQFAQVLRDNPVLRASEFQKVISDAVRYRQVMAAKQDLVQKPLPPAVRPGAQAPGASSHSSNAGRIAELTRQLNNASGQKALRIAAALTSERRKG